jgi:phospholipid/cholesterol/gamma-HCH transport system permease protein
LIGRIGRGITSLAGEASSLVLLPYVALKGAFIEKGRGRREVLRATASQVYYTAVEPLPFFGVLGVTAGLLTIVLADKLLRGSGLGAQVPSVVGIAIVREIVPLIVALVLVGRSGTAIATELGYMRVNHEIEALDALGINTDYFLVLPRMVGVAAGAVGLTVVTAAAGLAGGFFLGEALGLVSVGLRFLDILATTHVDTVLYAITKALLFGLAISAFNCAEGLAVGRSFTEIPRANVRGAVRCYVACFVLNAAISIYALPEGL